MRNVCLQAKHSWCVASKTLTRRVAPFLPLSGRGKALKTEPHLPSVLGRHSPKACSEHVWLKGLVGTFRAIADWPIEVARANQGVCLSSGTLLGLFQGEVRGNQRILMNSPVLRQAQFLARGDETDISEIHSSEKRHCSFLSTVLAAISHIYALPKFGHPPWKSISYPFATWACLFGGTLFEGRCKGKQRIGGASPRQLRVRRGGFQGSQRVAIFGVPMLIIERSVSSPPLQALDMRMNLNREPF